MFVKASRKKHIFLNRNFGNTTNIMLFRQPDYVKLPSVRISKGCESMIQKSERESFSSNKIESGNCKYFIPYGESEENYNADVNIIDEINCVFKKYFNNTKTKRGYHALFLKSNNFKCDQSVKQNQVTNGKSDVNSNMCLTNYGNVSQSFHVNRNNLLEDASKYYRHNYQKLPKRFSNTSNNNNEQQNTLNILDEEVLNKICGTFYSHK